MRRFSVAILLTCRKVKVGKIISVLVAPLKTVDRIIQLIPLVRDIFAGTIVTIPLKAHGYLKDPGSRRSLLPRLSPNH